MTTYQHLGIYSDLVAAAKQQQPLYRLAQPGKATRQQLREVLGFCNRPEAPIDVQIEDQWQADGIAGEAISWSVGYGPRTEAWLLKPSGANKPLPGILALHDHGGFKFYGKEKIALGRNPADASLQQHYEAYYGGRAYANALAREGFAVLIFDTFLWGSRRFPLETMPESIRAGVTHYPNPITAYNQAAIQHEHIVEKYCNLLGTTMAGVVAYEDRIALNYFATRSDVHAARIGCIGLSGGGNRAALLLATHDAIQAAVIVGLMTTYPDLLDQNVESHTWMLFPHGWARYGDWPDIAACRAPLPLLVQYDTYDNLFSLAGMQAAHQRLTGHYGSVGRPDAYTGQFYENPHLFDLKMQAAAFAWLHQTL
jgi:dienelactone hydrolase